MRRIIREVDLVDDNGCVTLTTTLKATSPADAMHNVKTVHGDNHAARFAVVRTPVDWTPSGPRFATHTFVLEA